MTSPSSWIPPQTERYEAEEIVITPQLMGQTLRIDPGKSRDPERVMASMCRWAKRWSVRSGRSFARVRVEVMPDYLTLRHNLIVRWEAFDVPDNLTAELIAAKIEGTPRRPIYFRRLVAVT